MLAYNMFVAATIANLQPKSLFERLEFKFTRRSTDVQVCERVGYWYS